MRILHTGDWHIGRTIRGRSRADEQRAVLAEIAGVARDRDVDVVVVAGDVFDSAAPSPEAEEIAYRALLDLAREDVPVVVVAGNHDNPRRLEAVRPLLRLGRVHVAANPAPPEAGGVVTLTTRGGEAARFALLPFLSRRGIVRADDLMTSDADQHAQAYADRAARILAALTDGAPADVVHVVVTHLMVAGGQAGGGERQAHIFGEYVVPPTAFPGALHYAALGHLHRAQALPAACPAWYAGAPLHLDFGETENVPAVLVVTAEPGVPAEVEVVPLTAGRRLRTVTGTLEQLEAMAGTTGDDHLRVVVDGPGRAGLADQVREWFPHAVDVIARRPDDAAPADHGRRLLARAPRDLFAAYLDDRGVADRRVAALFDELLDEADATDTA